MDTKGLGEWMNCQNTNEIHRFNWGAITEKKIDKYVVWEFYFYDLLSVYHQFGKQLSELQHEVFSLLEKKVGCSTRDIATVLGMSRGWYLTPSSSKGGFYLIAHFCQEEEARRWAMNNLISDAVPVIISQLETDVLPR